MDTAQRAKEDLRVFLWLMWAHLRLPPPTDAQIEMAQFMADPSMNRKLIMAMRGLGKSYVCSAYVLWRLYGDPDLNILVVSASMDRSTAFSRFTKMVINDWELLKDMRPKYNRGFDSVEKFSVGNATLSQSPSVKSCGLYGMLTGTRADVCVLDDLEIPNNSATILMQDKLSERVKEFAAILKPEEEGTSQKEIIYLGTPQTEGSLYTKLPERGYTTRIWPSRVPEDPDKYNGALAPSIYEKIANGLKPGTPLDSRFDHEELAAREAEYGRSGYALQFQLDCTLSDHDRFPLKCRDLCVMDIDKDVAPAKIMWSSDREHTLQLPMLGLAGDRWHSRVVLPDEKFLPYSGAMMSLDPSGRGQDETSYCISKFLHGQIFILDCGGMRDGYGKETLTKIATLARDYKVNLIQVEPTFGDGMIVELMKPILREIYPCTIEDGPRPSVQKEMRIIDVLEPLMNQHRIVVDRSLIERDATETDSSDPNYLHRRLFHQITRMQKSRGALRHDDRVDALSMACAYWNDQIAVSAQEQVDFQKEEELDEMLDSFMESVNGRKSRGPNWLDQSGL